jgi:asparagine synthase (glutamine-hydrolysing)
MQLCQFMLALSVGLSSVGGMPSTVARQAKRVVSAVRPIAGGHLWGHTESGAVSDRTFALSRGLRTWHGEHVDTSDVSQRLAAGDELINLAAPFAVATVDDSGRLSVATDHAGLRHIYAAQGDGWAAVSSSARDLARLVGAGLDRESMGVFRLVGHHLGTATPYRGVTKLAPGRICRLADGKLTVEPYPAMVSAPGPVRFESAVGRHAERLRATVEGFLDTHPGAVLELSGGLDSRMVLAAIPPSRRHEVRALTLTHPGSTDAPVAAALAARSGMAHQLIDLTAMAEVEPHEAYQAALDAALRLDAQGSPLGVAALDWVERQVQASPRLSGHGGELARGAYYMQRQHPHVRPVLVDRLARWWVVANAVPDRVLTPEFAAASRHETKRRLQEIFASYQTDWLTATDEFYLRERLHRWAGLTMTDAVMTRVVANPLLDPNILTLARAVPPEYRVGSRYAVRVLDRLDPDLARLPLGSGVRPVALSRRFTLSRQLGENTVRGFAVKAAGKVWRQIGRSRPRGGGLALLAGAVTAHLRAHPELVAPAADTGLLSEEWLDDYLSGRTNASPATIDMIVNLVVASRLDVP